MTSYSTVKTVQGWRRPSLTPREDFISPPKKPLLSQKKYSLSAKVLFKKVSNKFKVSSRMSLRVLLRIAIILQWIVIEKNRIGKNKKKTPKQE